MVETIEPVTKRQKLHQNEDEDEQEDLEKSVLDFKAESAPQLESLYLETVDRKALDFDFEKLCSVSLSNNNVYACLTCGKYYQGRGKSSYAYLHSVDLDHHVFINLDTLKVYALPEGYELKSKILDDIKYVIDPVYSKEQVGQLDSGHQGQHLQNDNNDALLLPRDLWRKPYTPGFMGLNNIKQNDYANVVFQTLSHVKPLRNFLILEPMKSELGKKMSLLVRKLWSHRAFKSHVSPQEIMECISIMSQKKYSPVTQKDPFAFLNWFLNQLHVALGGSRTKPQSSIVHKVFQGQLAQENSDKITPFMFLTLNLPKMPVFREQGFMDDLQDNDGDNSKASNRSKIPQVALTDLLKQFQKTKGYRLKRMPPYLILHFRRFEPNVDERNLTTVSFNAKSLQVNGSTYQLLANIVIDSSGGKLAYKVQLLDKSRDIYTEIQDLVIQQVQRELLVLSETYIQVWERVSNV